LFPMKDSVRGSDFIGGDRGNIGTDVDFESSCPFVRCALDFRPKRGVDESPAD
jgi:hypothetical protein